MLPLFIRGDDKMSKTPDKKVGLWRGGIAYDRLLSVSEKEDGKGI